MISIIKWEMKKSMKIGVVILWLNALIASYSFVNKSDVVNVMYTSIFNKYYKLIPLVLFTMFIMFSGSFTNEYNRNMKGLITSSKAGTKQFVLSKFIANGICASVINLSMLSVMVLKTMSNFGLEGLNLPVKELGNFSRATSDITVLQMLLILSITLIMGSFLFAALGLYLSSVNKKSTVPFIVGIILAGLPMMETLPDVIRINSPLYGMYSQQLIMLNAPISSFIVFVATVIAGSTALYQLTKKAFLKEA